MEQISGLPAEHQTEIVEKALEGLLPRAREETQARGLQFVR